MALLTRIIPDRFIWILIATIAVASIAPVRGDDVVIANLISSGAVFLIFLLHGIRLPPQGPWSVPSRELSLPSAGRSRGARLTGGVGPIDFHCVSVRSI